MPGRDEYVTVEATLEARTAKAALLNVGKDVGRGGWVPRVCLHFMSNKAVDEASIGDELELRVMEWVAEDRGLL